MQGVEQCSLCGSEIVKNLIYTNPSCRHNYCYYCLQEIQDTHFNLKFCFFKKCQKSFNANQLREFCKQCSEGESEKALKNKEIAKRLTCSCCFLEVNENNPIIYTNEKCGHSFCKSWFMLNTPPFDGNCFRATCTEQVNFEKIKEAFQKARIQSLTVRCNKCAKIVHYQNIFVNSACQHRSCMLCVKSSIFCGISNCQEVIDEEKQFLVRKSLTEEEEKLFLFKNSLTKEEKPKSFEQTVTCPLCARKITFPLSQGSKVNYWKCTHCLQTACSQHNGAMSKCLCFCPKCLGIYDKECNKCSISYCLKCGKENKIKEICPCSIAKPQVKIESIQNLFKKCGNIFLSNIPNNLHSYLDMTSSMPAFYMIGFLLTQYILSQPVSDETINLHQKVTSSFTSFIKINPDYKTKLERLQLMINDLSLTITNIHPFNGNNQLSVANFIMEISQDDSDLKEAFEWLGRCTLVDYMVSEGLNRRIPSVFKKWKNENSKPSDIDIEDVLSMFCESFYFKVQLFYQNGDKIDRNDFGQENARYTAQVLDLLNGPLAILYEK